MFPTILRREVLILIGIKAAALTLLYFLFFASPAHKAEESSTALREHIMGR